MKKEIRSVKFDASNALFEITEFANTIEREAEKLGMSVQDMGDTILSYSGTGQVEISFEVPQPCRYISPETATYLEAMYSMVSNPKKRLFLRCWLAQSLLNQPTHVQDNVVRSLKSFMYDQDLRDFDGDIAGSYEEDPELQFLVTGEVTSASMVYRHIFSEFTKEDQDED